MVSPIFQPLSGRVCGNLLEGNTFFHGETSLIGGVCGPHKAAASLYATNLAVMTGHRNGRMDMWCGHVMCRVIQKKKYQEKPVKLVIF